MSLSELFNISRTVRRDKAREQDLLPVVTSSRAAATRLCNICYTRPATYSCPRCNVPFCSLVCFGRREHQECSAAFSSSAVSLASASSELLVEDSDRLKVIDILDRLKRDESEVRQRTTDAQEEDSDDEDDEDDAAGRRANVTVEQVEGASTEALLAMLTPRERQKFMDAIRSPQSASALMQRLDRKADRHARLEPPEAHGVLISSESSKESVARRATVKRDWQSTPWFERSDASPNFSERPSDHESAFVASLESILAPRSTRVTSKDAPAPVNLVYNLCAVLMAYSYTLRHLDVASLSELTKTFSPKLRGVTSATTQSLAPKRDPVQPSATLVDDDDDEPPPLEPDEPISSLQADPLQPLAAETRSHSTDPTSHSLDNVATAEEALANLDRLVPFLFPQPPRTANRSSSFAPSNDSSKVVLASLHDASMWLLSRLSLDSEAGQGGADAIDLQLSDDLARLLAAEPLTPSFEQDEQVEPKYKMASKLASLPPHQAFAAAQTPLLLNAVVDMYFYLEDLVALVSAPSSPLLPTRVKSKGIKLAQRKLCFYLCNAALGNDATTDRTCLRLRQELQTHTQRLRQRIEATSQADKLAAAVSLLNRDTSASST